MIIVSSEYNRNTGVGNKLFPWSRAKIFSAENNCRMLDPVWFSPRGAAIIRGGVSYKSLLSRFWLYKNFVKEEDSISRSEYNRFYKDLKKVFFDDLVQAKKDGLEDDTHYTFKWNTSHHFIDLQGYQKFLFESLNNIIAPKHRAFIKKYESKLFIGMHVRTGKDFASQPAGPVGSSLTQLDWFIHALKETRKKIGNLPAIIVSDGGTKQLKRLLDVENTVLLNSSSAISDLIVLAHAKLLLGSGHSSFSAWASFLGGMDTYSSHATSFDKYFINYNDEGKQIVDII